MLTAGIVAVDLVTPLGVAVHLLYVIPLLLTIRLSSRTAPIVYAGICLALGFVGAYYSSPGPIGIAYKNRLLALPVLGITALLVMHYKRLEEEYHRFFTLSPDLLCIAGRDGFFKRLNPAWTRTLGYPVEELLAEPWLHFVHPDDRDATIQAAQTLAAGESLLAFQNRYRCKDGSYRWLSWTATPSRDQGLIYATARDVTERKRAEEELRKAHEAAETANQAKSEFLSRMSHELRTPLNAVLGFAQLLELDPLSPEQHQHVRHILKAGRHLLTLINEVLDIARIEAGRMTVSLEPVSVAAVIAEAVDLIRPQAAGRNLQLVTPSVQEETAYVRADRQGLKQVLLNLLSNGVKFNRDGGRLTVSCQAVPEGRYRLTITDTGGGIPPALLSRLFTPFDRLGANSGTEGTGLGLVLSRGLITMMGGTISVDSVVGQGTSVSVELPLSEPPAVRAETVADTVRITAPVAGGVFTVLCVEDNLSNYQLIERLVERRSGVRLLSAMQGKLGVELAASHRPDLILLDLNLPDIPGEEVLLRLRERPETAVIPVVVLSADAMPKQIDKLLAAGAQGYLTKPIEMASFYAVLDEWMTKKRGAGA